MPKRDQVFSEDQFTAATERESRPGPWVAMNSSRLTEARYDRGLEQVHVRFREGAIYVYDGVPENIWRNFRRSASPGKFVNRVLNGFTYWQGSDATGADGGEA